MKVMARRTLALTKRHSVLNSSWDNKIGSLPLRLNVLVSFVSTHSTVIHNEHGTFSKFGFTKPNHCLMQPSMSLPRSRTSRTTSSKVSRWALSNL